MKTAATTFFNLILTAGLLFSAGTAAAQNMSINSSTWEHCGCDTQKGIEQYVQNLVNDALQRGMVCEAANGHIPACITVWCSTCAGHPGAVQHCMATANEYLVSKAGYCTQQQPAAHLSSVFSGVDYIN